MTKKIFCIALTFLTPIFSSSVYADEGDTVEIYKGVPPHIKLFDAPDEYLPYYWTKDNTDFSYRCYVPYTLIGGQAAVEVCEINPVHLEILNWPETEVINLIRGKVKVTELNGKVKTYKAGDIFVLPKGFRGHWYQKGQILKVTVRNPLFWTE